MPILHEISSTEILLLQNYIAKKNYNNNKKSMIDDVFIEI